LLPHPGTVEPKPTGLSAWLKEDVVKITDIFMRLTVSITLEIQTFAKLVAHAMLTELSGQACSQTLLKKD